MMKRPDHATDCPACDGWIGGGDTLCVQCSDRVWKHDPAILNNLLEGRKNGDAAMASYWKGFMVGTAKALFMQRSKPAGRSARAPLKQKGAAS